MKHLCICLTCVSFLCIYLFIISVWWNISIWNISFWGKYLFWESFRSVSFVWHYKEKANRPSVFLCQLSSRMWRCGMLWKRVGMRCKSIDFWINDDSIKCCLDSMCFLSVLTFYLRTKINGNYRCLFVYDIPNSTISIMI